MATQVQSDRVLPGPRSTRDDTAWCHAKRFFERWNADADFRAMMPKDPSGTLRAYDLHVDAEDVRAQWDGSLLREQITGTVDDTRLSAPVQEYRRQVKRLLAWRSRIFADAIPEHPRWKAWRERQIARSKSEMGERWTRQIIFSTAAYEISRGCSVGCWFCGVGAPKLSDHFYRTPENARLFRATLEAVAELTGAASLRSQFLYWASDPFDNPDYEKHCEDYMELAGTYPAVTTALAMKNVERTRTWLRTAPQKGLPITRFSILTLGMLNRIHRAFTPEEMADVECVLLNEESNLAKANAGRYREKAMADPGLREKDADRLRAFGMEADADNLLSLGPSTIACVSGLLFNMVDRTVRLIAPCKASDRWPLGYVVFGEGRFDSAGELKEVLARLVGEAMAGEPPARAVVSFREDVKYERTEAGFTVSTVHGGTRFERHDVPGYCADLGDLIGTGRYTPEEIGDRLFGTYGIFPGDTDAAIAGVFRHGYLVDEPPLAASAPVPQRIELKVRRAPALPVS